MTIWMLLIVVAVFGLIGGAVNALLTDNGFLLPRLEEAGQGAKRVRVWRPGIVGNVAIGAVAAAISWGLYGPLAAEFLVGGPPRPPEVASQIGVTLSAAVGAMLVGIGGARWLSNEVDKNLLRAAASGAAGQQANDNLAARIAVAAPAEALRIAHE